MVRHAGESRIQVTAFAENLDSRRRGNDGHETRLCRNTALKLTSAGLLRAAPAGRS
jgi:hypothetical protein